MIAFLMSIDFSKAFDRKLNLEGKECVVTSNNSKWDQNAHLKAKQVEINVVLCR